MMASLAKNVVAKFDAQLIGTLFRLADEDRDGAIAGGEAVKFFLRSGLSQECLGQVRGEGHAISEFRSASEHPRTTADLGAIQWWGCEAQHSTIRSSPEPGLVSSGEARAISSMRAGIGGHNMHTSTIMPSGQRRAYPHGPSPDSACRPRPSPPGAKAAWA